MVSPFPFVVAVWDDAWGDAGEQTEAPQAHMKHRSTVMETVGWLLVDNEKGVSIFNERCLDDGSEYYRGRTFIPRVLIRSVTPFTLARKRNVQKAPPPAAPARPEHEPNPLG